MKWWVVICWALLTLAGADECPDGGRCEGGQTCCNSPASGYGCCPFEQAECCEDHMHCCPAGTICDTAKSSCVNATVCIPWAERASADKPGLTKSFRMIKTYMGQEDDNICPDQSRCPPEFSCLRTLTRFGCCPLAQGVPCSDGKHCCPEGLQCSADSRSCIKTELVTTVICSDGVSECPDGTTCCETPDGKWGCCPMPEAVCCEDKLHCCPGGSTCDIKHSKCISVSTKKVMPMWDKLPARRRAEWENKKGEQMTAEAVDNGETEKVTAANTVPLSEEEVAVSSVTKAAGGNAVPCNDTVACQDGSTCCKTKEGGWACCPLPEAVCCKDFIHCCPKGKTCNLASQTCDGVTGSVSWVEKLPAIPRQGVQARNVTCDSTASCPDGSTCCKTKEGGWACCPLPEAVCCEDFIHCCPKGKKCNLAAQTCDGDIGSLPWVEKLPAIPRRGVRAGNVTCDSTASCPDGSTCCKTKEGGWACCPLPEAVCCQDFIHCCPKGKTCNLAAQTCDGDTGSLPWVEKLPAIPRHGVRARNITCDSKTSCPDDNTCCKTKKGGWACCPLPEAVCCDDHEHCCPSGTTCDLTTLTCQSTSGSTPIKLKTPAFTTVAPTTEAPTTQTSTVSTEEEQKVPEEDEVITVQEMHEDEEWDEEDEKDNKDVQGRVQCDGHTSCPQSTTCCFMASTHKWGCCPLPDAVCCADGSHCCPNHYKCDEHKTSCIKGEVVIPWYTKLPATTSVQVHAAAKYRDVPCDGKTTCKDGETCCKMSATTWGCCPIPNAVCCSDMEHCCPSGYTCTDTGDCTKDIRLHWFNWHMFIANKKRALVV